MEDHNAPAIQLAPPGAGLPFVELVISRMLFGFARRDLVAQVSLGQISS